MGTHKWPFVALVVGLGLAAAVAAPTVWYAWSSAALERELAGCRAAGLASTRAALALPPVAPSENAAADYARAAALCAEQGRECGPGGRTWESVLRDLGARAAAEPWSAEDRTAAAGAVAYFAVLDEPLAAGASRRECRYDAVYGRAGAINALQSLHAMTRYLALRARGAAEAGRAAEAWAALDEEAALADSLRDEPSLACCATRLGMLRSACDQAARLLARGQGPADEAAGGRWPRRSDMYAHMQRACSGEFVAALGPLRSLVVDGSSYWTRGLAADEVKEAVGHFRQAYVRAGQPFWQLPGGAAEELPRQLHGVDLTALAQLDALLVQRDEVSARLELLQLALRLERHRAAQGSYPDRLADLADGAGGAAAEDPFTGQAYGYARHGAGGRLWSAGPDGVNNGGDAATDIVISLQPTASPEGSPAATAGAAGPAVPADSSPPAAEMTPARDPSEGTPGTITNWRQFWADRARQQEPKR